MLKGPADGEQAGVGFRVRLALEAQVDVLEFHARAQVSSAKFIIRDRRVQARGLSEDRGAILTGAMLLIRAQQMQAFEQASMARFERRMVAHLRQLAPKHCKAVGEAGLRQVVRVGFARAKDHGFTKRGPVKLYLDLMIMLGSDFDSDPQYPWAAALLDDPDTPDEMARAERLYEKAIDYSAKVFGPDYEQEKAAVRRAGLVRYEDLPSFTGGSADQIVAHFEAIFPEKVHYLGKAPILALSAEAMALANQHGLEPERGPAVLAGLMFAFGHGVTTDPQFPWVAATLVKHAQDAATRTERLFRRALTYQRLGEERPE
jgi:hypothetical protein